MILSGKYEYATPPIAKMPPATDLLKLIQVKGILTDGNQMQGIYYMRIKDPKIVYGSQLD